MTVDLVLARLHKVRPNAKGWVALCPAHEDRSASLSVARGRRDGYVLLNCFRGCERGAILDALGLAEVSDRPEPYIAPPVDEQEEAHRLAVGMARDQAWARGDTPLLMASADLHRQMLSIIGQLTRSAEFLGPDSPAAWDMLQRAGDLESERRVLEHAMEGLVQG